MFAAWCKAFWGKITQKILVKKCKQKEFSDTCSTQQDAYRLHVLQAHKELTKIEYDLIQQIVKLNVYALSLHESLPIDSTNLASLLADFELKKEELIRRIKQLEVIEIQLGKIDQSFGPTDRTIDSKEILKSVETTFNDIRRKIS